MINNYQVSEIIIYSSTLIFSEKYYLYKMVVLKLFRNFKIKNYLKNFYHSINLIKIQIFVVLIPLSHIKINRVLLFSLPQDIS